MWISYGSCKIHSPSYILFVKLLCTALPYDCPVILEIGLPLYSIRLYELVTGISILTAGCQRVRVKCSITT